MSYQHLKQKPTSAHPRVVDGVTFRCYHTGIHRNEWISDDGRSRALHNYRMTYYDALLFAAS